MIASKTLYYQAMWIGHSEPAELMVQEQHIARSFKTFIQLLHFTTHVLALKRSTAKTIALNTFMRWHCDPMIVKKVKSKHAKRVTCKTHFHFYFLNQNSTENTLRICGNKGNSRRRIMYYGKHVKKSLILTQKQTIKNVPSIILYCLLFWWWG